ncbi:MAG: type VI secretion system baseplate subunit TssK, partial [Alphaproteobacteria bacterium]|nr:type VI secretion system baseplate subunit TssK [Alphaproteobacteria bacterium]
MGGATINPVQWAEGALLTPQHFQHLTRCWRLESSYYLNYMSPFYWGVTGFKYDEALLVSGKFRILEIDAILPDGLVISSTGTSETALELDLKAISDQMVEKPLTIYLAVPAYRPNEANVSGDFPRYHSVEGKPSINDETGEGAVSIPELKPILSLVPSNEALPPRYVSIPLVQAQYKDDAFTLTPFIAPRLYLEQESTLGQIISPILKQLREKAAFLSEKVS